MSGWLIKTVIGFASLYGIVLLAAWSLQRSFVYFPDPQRIAPHLAGLSGVSERVLKAPDGATVIAWYAPPRPGRPVVLYFHGNGGNLLNRAEVIRRFMAEGLGVYMMTYRGYGGSTGRPSERDNLADARRAYADVESLGHAPRDIVLYGESLGTGIASRLATELTAAALVLEAPFTSIVALGQSQFPFLPLHWIMTERYATIEIIDRVAIPLLVLHGDADGVVPIAMGRKVFEAASRAHPKRLAVIPGAGHSDHMRFGSMDIVLTFINGLSR